MPVMIYNPAKIDLHIKKGILLATYNLMDEDEEIESITPTVNKIDIINEMLPRFDTVEVAGTRREKLKVEEFGRGAEMGTLNSRATERIGEYSTVP